jgi:hypothetical protein
MKFARALGVLLQAIVLGVLLFTSIGSLVALEADARVFRYQAF